MRKIIVVLFSTLLVVFAQAQSRQELNISWANDWVLFGLKGSEVVVPQCHGCEFGEGEEFAPFYLGKLNLGKNATVSQIEIKILKSRDEIYKDAKVSSAIPENLTENITWYVGEERGSNVLLYRFPAALKAQSGAITLIEKFEIRYSAKQIARRSATHVFKDNSVLAQGEWFKIGVVSDGVYKITSQDLAQYGIDVKNLNPQNLNIYGNGYGQLPYQNNIERPDDLLINNIFVSGEEDGVFDDTDYILFYARGPHSWYYNETSGLFNHSKHNYVDTSYYFIGINTGDLPARISNTNSLGSSPDYVVTTFNDYVFHEIDRENMLKSGREWYGEKFDVQTAYNYSGEKFTFPNIDPTSETVVRANVISRTTVPGNCTFTLELNGKKTESNISSVGTGISSTFANERDMEVRLNAASPALNINITYRKNAPSATGWLNWFNINTRRQLRMSGNQMSFRDALSVAPGRISRFELQNVTPQTEIWEVTNPTKPTRIVYTRNNDVASFVTSTNDLKEFIAFNGGFKTPGFFGRVENQNLHALGASERIDMVIVSPGILMKQAEGLADIHRNYEPDPLNVIVVRVEEIYNEFSSGMRDVTAIKWFMKMLYEKANGNEQLMPRYLLLFGDGSYDNKNFTAGNTNLIPTYQSVNSLSPAGSYVSDDYFVLLGDEEGEGHKDQMDMGVGRIVAKNVQEANSVVNKIRKYMEITPQILTDDCTVCGDNSTNFGSWRNAITMIADDGDNNMHMAQARSLADRIQDYSREYNIERIFLDAFPEVATPGGARFPAANKAIERSVERGAFITNYVGHGGELGWAAERILDIPTIQGWTNGARLPVFMTATCEFTRFDDPLRTSAGEFALLNGNGGAIALLTTTRLVYSAPNEVLNRKFYDALFNRPDNEVITRLGDLNREAKNATAATASSSNHRNFSLIGDPALPLAIPKYKINVLSLTDTLENPIDTLKALGVVRVTGNVTNANGDVLSSFNGRLNATVFDRVETKTTLANKSGSTPFIYPTQEKVVYKGNAEVKNGLFSFDFVIPKDISYAVDSTARISLYASGGVTDATGYKDSLIIGGRDANAINDGKGPDINLYLNDENFVYGGYTNNKPVLVASLFDENGINTVGSGIGHDITAVLNGDENNAIVLNDYYESDLNTYKSGKIQYQFDELKPGEHHLKLKVWDVHNNSNEAEIEFIVAEEEDFTIKRVLNYPNPFTTHTEFFFEHNQSCEFLNVLVQIYTVSGKLVKTINTVSNTDGFRNEPIPWDGRDDYGDKLATGVYVYKLAVRNPAGEQVDKFEKLVILN